MQSVASIDKRVIDPQPGLFDSELYPPGGRPYQTEFLNGEGPLTVAYGMGVDSTAMLIWLAHLGVRPDLITFADVGDEKPETYEYLSVINEWLKRVGFPLVRVVRYTPQRFKNAPYSTLGGNCLSNKTLPSISFNFRWKRCSIKWKMAPQEVYLFKFWEPGIEALEAGIPIRRLIGYDAGPKDEQRGAVEEKEEITFLYPLQEWGFDRQACSAIIEASGLPLPPKSACFFCASSHPEEILNLARKHPDLARRAVLIERNASSNFKTIKGLGGSKGETANWEEFLKRRMGEEDFQWYVMETTQETTASPPVPLWIETCDPYREVWHYE